MPKRKPSSHFAKQAQEAYELSLAGFSYRQIAEKMGVSLATVQRRLELYVKDRVHPKADEYRAQQIDRLRIYIRSLWSQILAGDPKSIAQAVRTEERIARLMGIDLQQETLKLAVSTNESDSTEFMKMLLDFQIRKGKDTTTLQGEIVKREEAIAAGKPLPRHSRPVPDWYLEKERKQEEARQAAKNAPLPDEFANANTFRAHEVQEEEFRMGDESDFEPAPRPRRRGKPIPNPTNKLLRDYDD